MLGKVLLRNSPRDAVPTNKKTTLEEKISSRRKVMRTPTCEKHTHTHTQKSVRKMLSATGSRVYF